MTKQRAEQLVAQAQTKVDVLLKENYPVFARGIREDSVLADTRGIMQVLESAVSIGIKLGLESAAALFLEKAQELKNQESENKTVM